MSRKNKVNPDHYKVAGRLSPDDLAREWVKQDARRDVDAWYESHGQSAGRTGAERAGVSGKPGGSDPSSQADSVAKHETVATRDSRRERRPSAPGGSASSAKMQRTSRRGRPETPAARTAAAKKRATAASKKMSATARDTTKNKPSIRKSGSARAGEKR